MGLRRMLAYGKAMPLWLRLPMILLHAQRCAAMMLLPGWKLGLACWHTPRMRNGNLDCKCTQHL